MRINAPTQALSAVALAGLLVSGCGGTSPGVAADEPTTPTSSASPTPVVTPTPAPTRKPKPTRSPTTGTGDGEGDDTPATAGGGICSDLAADEVGSVLGASVTGAALPGGGCIFAQDDDRRPAVSIVESSFAASPGGMDGAKNDATSAVEGTPVDLTGIGDAAFVVTGTAFGGADLQGAGAVVVGDRLISVNVAQSTGLSRATVKKLVVDLLRLAATKLA